MSDLIMPRRKFLAGLVGLVAAPAVVKASSLMAVKPIVERGFSVDDLHRAMIAAREAMMKQMYDNVMFGNIYDADKVMNKVMMSIGSGGGSGREMTNGGSGGSGGRWNYMEAGMPFTIERKR